MTEPDDPAALVETALRLLARAKAAATTPRDRQTVAIATAYLAGDLDRVDVLARDHLADHPGNELVARIAGIARTPGKEFS
ncbi:hypothetical protein BJ973_002862 [Actinoplanes tereljensis]|uniref:Uncharacterized protein n=1 Tax=Paractinoplanes tereljensis TaxID=571912 RepID=A0A919NPZ3_9ACTN|nr:hypothetical protein [Actinoplanes tereljensis]GIF22538.1 hypothetical protein Ate02nite_52680 [Actinoplanes tereljensis]